jgi:cytochrome c553
MRNLAIGLLSAFALAAAVIYSMGLGDNEPAVEAGKPVVMPELTGVLLTGQAAYEAKCSACHGVELNGVDQKGPPLLHDYYEPNHHGDAAIVSAIRVGAPAHHWKFGDMPPVEGMGEADIAAVVAFIRAVQKANGIF